MLRSATNAFPTEILMKSKFFFIGRILQLLEVRDDTLALKTSRKDKPVGTVMSHNHLLFLFKIGIRADGLKDLFGTDLSFGDFQSLFNVVSVRL